MEPSTTYTCGATLRDGERTVCEFGREWDARSHALMMAGVSISG
ncbi:MAG: hypothetical protein RI885_1987 [Actinomycetota bacterium]|jgi:hypothetical protein